MSSGATNLISINIDGRDCQVEPNLNVIEACARHGVEVPHYCYHPFLSVPGNCRMCLVETGTPAVDRDTKQAILNPDGTPKIAWIPKPVIGCATKISPGMHIRTDSAVVRDCRHGVMEFLLINHPLDCPICDQAGECRLQEFATDYGRGYSRFVENKNHKPKRTRIGPRVMLDDERCILCSRCIRFCQEVAKDDVLGFTDRGSYTTLTTFPGKELANNYSLCTVDICPVGALTSTDFRFRMRVWFLKETDSIDIESSAGCNITVGSREGVIYRLTPRRNDFVNDTWMPDSGRNTFQEFSTDDRLTGYSIEGRPCGGEEALEHAAGLLKQGGVAIIASGRLSVEEQYVLRKIRDLLPGPVPTFLLARHGEGDNLLLSADRNPNVRGALLTGLITELPEATLEPVGRLIDAGAVKTLLIVGENPAAAGVSVEQIKRTQAIYLGTHHNDACQYARVEIPLLSVFEKSGTFVNRQFRLQRFHQAIPGPAAALFGLSNFTRLHAAVAGEKVFAPSPSTVWKHLAAEVPEFQGLGFGEIPATGVALDAKRFAHLPFVEGPGLHYQPERAAVTAQA